MTVTAYDDLPIGSLLQAYRDGKAYTDAFAIDLLGDVTLARYVEAFYTSPLFKLERLVLATLARRPSSDTEARALAFGERTKFAAWTVEAREADQIIMCDYMNKTRSWLMRVPLGEGTTRLWFGSAVVPERVLSNGRVYLGAGFQQLIAVHQLYSRALLHAAARRCIQ